MATINRVGTGLLLAGSLILASLMAYTLLLADGYEWAPRRPVADQVDVAIVVPEQNTDDWEDFRAGILACRSLGLVGPPVEVDGRTTLTLGTPGGRRLRLLWYPASGFALTRQAVRDLWTRPNPPAAIIGSENTALTAALAEALRDAAGPAPSARDPVLIVPWATALIAEPDSPGEVPVPLLEIYPGRTFRFGPDNRRAAELLIQFALEQGPTPPGRVIVVSDPVDPFSRDLARAVGEVLPGAVPGAEVQDQPAVPVPTMPSEALDPEEGRWAESIWAQARAGAEAGDGPTWLVLPLQSEPTRRLLRALGALAPLDAASIPLRVLCGDGIGTPSLSGLAGSLPFPVSAASAGFAAPDDHPIPRDAQLAAEIVLALVRALDDPAAEGDLAAALRRLDVPADVLGRSIAFQPSGERRGEDLGQILSIQPGSRCVFAQSRRPDGGWTDPVRVTPEDP